ncbi:mannose-6-phosphate isomerase [Lachnospiraceae bacterium KM106-2]|nr:mannose-6-phosphate isomerase [Lachnospiraceae bacterium KM106-2]
MVPNSNPIVDYGPNPFVVNIEEETNMNTNFRTTLWTGEHLQVTLMSIQPGGEIGAEIHDNVDQFIRIEEGRGIARFGYTRETMLSDTPVDSDYAILVPAGIWHNLINTGNEPLKVYSIYAPPEHPFNTVHRTKEEADVAENE